MEITVIADGVRSVRWPLFKDRVDEMIAEYENIVPPKPKYNYAPMMDSDDEVVSTATLKSNEL